MSLHYLGNINSEYCIISIISLTANTPHITALCRSGFYQLRQIRPAIQSLTPDTARTIVQAFIACRLDWCNSPLYGVPENLLRKVQSVQNAAAHLLTGARRSHHITPMLCQLHWLAVLRRVEFKIAFLVHQSLASLAPTYLTADIHLVSEYGRRLLRSSMDRTQQLRKPIANLVMEALLLQDLVYGTVCLLACVRSLATDNLGDI